MLASSGGGATENLNLTACVPRADAFEAWLLEGLHVGGVMVRSCQPTRSVIGVLPLNVPKPQRTVQYCIHKHRIPAFALLSRQREHPGHAGAQLICWTLMLRLHPRPLIYTPSYEYRLGLGTPGSAKKSCVDTHVHASQGLDLCCAAFLQLHQNGR